MIKFGSLIGFGLAVFGMLILIDKNYIYTINPIAIIIQIFSVGLMIWSRITFGRRSFHATANVTEGKLVTNGPYRWLRHPIYASIIYFSWACLISFPYLWAFIAVLLVTGGLFLRMILEEKSLKESYPEYVSYSKRAKRIIPFIF